MAEDAKPAVTLAGPGDAADLAILMAEIDTHYQGRTLPVEERAAQAGRFLAEAENGLRYALARTAGRPVGAAFFILARHGLVTPGSLFLKDLYVSDAARGAGIGEALMRFVARFALHKGVSRIDLSVDAPNTGAARFYAVSAAGTKRASCFTVSTAMRLRSSPAIASHAVPIPAREVCAGHRLQGDSHVRSDRALSRCLDPRHRGERL
ncbi:GNAT family N-acetyltransferase [Breoghania sp. L-A4]|uniref:GNAT family N-acetyltransferase n=1 Tax=Breoghania sp. L-A4 TaxID=2304600 RepID=UPI000E35DC8F|nr:GNAT family N-acetyltransferase [Breoghania sp. L-A4]AXS42247.1 GNAT family N-acetyltransferase [Breoghania sp. L-A4]